MCCPCDCRNLFPHACQLPGCPEPGGCCSCSSSLRAALISRKRSCAAGSGLRSGCSLQPHQQLKGIEHVLNMRVTHWHNSAAVPLLFKVLPQPVLQQLSHSPNSLPGYCPDGDIYTAVPLQTQFACNTSIEA